MRSFFNTLPLTIASLSTVISCIFSIPAMQANASNHITPKIIGGDLASKTDWPWVTALVYKSDVQVFCGGSLIAKNWVLTAAHCVIDKPSLALEALINRPNVLSKQGERIGIKQIILHPLFNRITLENDIALLKLATTSRVDPIEILDETSNQDAPGQSAIALGWGNTSTYREAYPDDLQQVILPIVSNTTCQEHMTGIQDHMLCAGVEEGGKDTCSGDSGGPLVVYDNVRGTWRQAAITSFGEAACAAKGYYGVYTRLKKFNRFITQNICTPEQTPPSPILSLSIHNDLVTANWNMVAIANGYRLYYAPYPFAQPVASLTPTLPNRYATHLPKGSAFYVGITASNGICQSHFSNIEYFNLP